ncbi:ATP-binding protein [Candidatus Pelagibacter sp. RS40]|uniref:ATP-binding protein n=1 Tax=Candidatus Pelagibacter sp. RS40 TaxID=1977865 RepID=UPI000A15F658|nr:ATP-binding protein [Candidatus Pelagibacter sp. RS40]ARJ48467.1 two-component sensor histidine kinase [Candidatus Pelagibacter sp. RS40]
MELLIVILLLIIGLLTFLLLKKERVLGIKPETASKNTEVKIVENKEYRKNIFDLLNSIPEGILILDKSKKIIFSNNSSTKLFDTKINENISGSLRNPDLLSSIDKIFEDKNIPDFEIEIRNKAVLRLNITIYLDKNNLFFDEVTCVLFIRDLTEFHKFQQLKSDFVANVSHELRTPLQSIKMGLETIDNIKDLKENNELNNLMPLMTSQSERMENLIRDLLSLSKIELQEHIRPTHEIDLIELIDYVIKTYEKIISKNNISIKFNKTDNLKIIGDRDKLIEIFTNLIDNSIKYSDKNKEVTITAKKDGDFNIVSVADKGIGIPKESIHRITERFFTVDPSKSRSVGGTGLGLAIVKHLVSQHRAEMDINSVENEGTTIDIKFNSL